MAKRKLNDFNNKTQEVIKLLKLHGTQTILGTGADKLMDYISDIDLQEFVKCKNDDETIFKEILIIFQDKFNKIENKSNIFITDFKCGVLYGGIPIRWNKDTIKKGYQIIEDRKINFIDCLKQTSTIKIDIIALIDGKFTEFSENYYLTLGNYKTFNDINKHYLNVGLLRNYQKYIKEDKPFKALKRLYSYQKLNNKINPKLITFLNSKIGKLNKLSGDIEILINILDLPIIQEVIKRNLQLIADELPSLYKNKLKEIINNYSNNEELKIKLEQLREEINNKIRENTNKWIKNNS